MKKNLLISIWMTLATTVLLGILYPLAVTVLAQWAFPRQANGEIIHLGGGNGGIEPDWAAVYFSGIFSFAAFGCGGCRIRSGCVQWRSVKFGADEFGVDDAREW